MPVITLLRRRRVILLVIATGRPVLLVIALLRRRRAILLVIATGRPILLVIALPRRWRRRAVSVGRWAIARTIIVRRRRRSWTRGSPEYGERQRREGQCADNDATDKARAATIIATAPIVATVPGVAAMTPAGVCR